MIPLVVGAIGVGLGIANVMTYAATSGASYAMGRKYGRIICEKLDHAETIVKASIDKFK